LGVLPVILYKDVSEITEDYLSEKYIKIKHLLNDRRKLYRKFWIDKFKS